MKSENKTRNITLVTWKGVGNYGTCLQSFALNYILRKFGYNVRFLPALPKSYSIVSSFKLILSCFGIKTLRDIIRRRNLPPQDVKRETFQRDNFSEVSIYTKWQEKNLVAKTDCFITGSDQIWNTYYLFDKTYFLSFAGMKKRIAYASSIGTNSIKQEYRDKVKELLLRFNHIGVREQEAVRVLSELTGRKDIIHVLDPTFLLSPDDWKKMAVNAEYEIDLPEEYILCYLIGNNSWYKEDLQDVQTKTGVKNIIIIPSAENPDFSCEGAVIYKNACPVEFVDLLQKATFVCTDSFHATALSINHSIPFVEFMRFKDGDKTSQNSRIYDLLRHYGLMNRIYDKESDGWIAPIDYHVVQNILNDDRKQSMDYLINAIEY